MTNIELTQLFSVPIYTTRLNSLTEEIKTSLKQMDVRPADNTDSYYSVNNDVLSLPEYKSLYEEVDFHVKNFAYGILKIKDCIEFYLTRSWVYKQNTGNYAGYHRHSNSVLSGVMYFDEDPNFGNIVFTNNSNNLCDKLLQLDYTEYNEINSEIWWMKPRKNMLLLFPSNLYHSTEKNKSDKVRYSLAFNYFVKGEFGDNVTFLKF